ncbi:hypothetical protein [Endozoicomonas euniceicola]|uniref:Uncharacterized protein n=1 Tax=Endozoicomonas euniceicola TaxID=1234143 RepID=A0ABY6H139_9GAMM|nr:hypothetical protein [Endozoicomonas euniceicola]UYM18630.1 hypothetical protein NX720_12250 [Endozoicomonas euniceicola]
MFSFKISRLSRTLVCSSLLISAIPKVIAASWEPHHCLFDYANTLPSEEMAASLKHFASKEPDLWKKIPEHEYQKFNSFEWKSFDQNRESIGRHCQCAYPHSESQSLGQLKKRFEENAKLFSENQKKIQDYDSSWFKIFKNSPEEFQINRDILFWSCDEGFFIPEFDLPGLNQNYPSIQEVLLTITQYVADQHSVQVKGGTFIDRHHEVIETGIKAKAKKLEKQTELSVNIEPDSISIAEKFDSSFLTHLERAQKEGKGIYSYLEFISGENEVHRYYTTIKVNKGKSGNIEGLEVYDPMVMVKLYFPVDKSGKHTKLPDFYQSFANALMQKHDISGVRQITKVKYKVLFLSEKKDKHEEM